MILMLDFGASPTTRRRCSALHFNALQQCCTIDALPAFANLLTFAAERSSC